MQQSGYETKKLVSLTKLKIFILIWHKILSNAWFLSILELVERITKGTKPECHWTNTTDSIHQTFQIFTWKGEWTEDCTTRTQPGFDFDAMQHLNSI